MITVEAVDKSGNVTTKSVTLVMDKIKDISWQKTFGGVDDDEANSIQQTKDGGYIIAGWTRSFGSGEKDAHILKLNSKGEVEWQKTFGGVDDDEANSIQQTKDGGYIVAGYKSGDVYILKLNSKGEIEWQKTFGGEYSDEANSVQEIADGGYVVAGWTYSSDSEEDVYILKLNSKGELEWQKTFGGKYDDVAELIQQTKDGGYIVAGYKGGDVYILKLNSKGEVEWQKTFGGKYGGGANSIQQTADGGYIVAGWTYSFGSGEADVYILKLNSKGEDEWEKTFGGEYRDEANSIQQTTDGGYIVAGWTSSFGFGEADVYILKLNSKGQLEWEKTFGGEDSDWANSIQQTADGGYIVAGYSSGDFYILKLNSKGEIDN